MRGVDLDRLEQMHGRLSDHTCSKAPVCMLQLTGYIFRDCFIIASVNSGTSIFGGFAVFSVLGFMAAQQNTTVAEVAESGNIQAEFGSVVLV